MGLRHVVAAVASVLVLGACGSGEGAPDSTATSSSSPSVPTTSAEAEPAEEQVEEGNAIDETPVEETAETVAQPHIIDCQRGLGPVETYWSDGTVTGYSEYCQSVSDATLREEREANTPVCDGAVCRYPSGAEMPDPNAQPAFDVPYTCNYDVLCDDAGNVIPGPGGPEVGVLLGNGQTCAGNGCTRPR
ncbi:hypothetical protein [Dietzia cercidiphylli]|uniref:Lipoprotein n=1 Tax=Dietzia cercidiphylli TaxID=498199 RepID=A0ABN2JAD1_9ACTN|nr:hypothetical protein [Dietzia cercidiphylli]